MKENGRNLLGSLDEESKAAELAEAATYSRAQFYRLAKKELASPPMATRRRLLMERSAYELCNTQKSITEIAFDAKFGSLEGYSRCFRRAFGLSPSRYRALGPGEWRLSPGARLHYAPSSTTHEQGDPRMDSVIRMLDHHCHTMAQFLDLCSRLSDQELDQPTHAQFPLPWSTSTPTLRHLVGRACAFTAPWDEAINHIKRDYAPAELADMRTALDQSKKSFMELYRCITEDNTWDLTFIDSVCEPAEVFTYGGVIAHMITNNALRRNAVFNELRARGHSDLEYSDPMDYLR